jgi:hypothetical protein
MPITAKQTKTNWNTVEQSEFCEYVRVFLHLAKPGSDPVGKASKAGF